MAVLKGEHTFLLTHTEGRRLH